MKHTETNFTNMAECTSENVFSVPPRIQPRQSKELPPRDVRYDITMTELQQLMQQRPCNEAHDVIQRHYGGISGICNRLYTSPNKGISGVADDINHRKVQFGTNTIPNQPLNTDKFPVIRGGVRSDISISEIVVGDVCEVKNGDIVPADGVIVHCTDMKADESELTGEVEYVEKGEENCPLLFSGSRIMQGNGRMLVVAVGVNVQKDIKFN